MSDRKRTVVSYVSDTAIVRFTDRKIFGTDAKAAGEEMISIVQSGNCKDLLLDFHDVEFVSSALLNMLIILDKHVRAAQGKLRLTNLCVEILELFALTRLNKKFDISTNVPEASDASKAS